MRLFATFKIALRALQRNKMRTALTMLGMVIGVGAVIAMVSIGNGAKAQVEAQIASLGQNLVLVMSGSVTRGGMHTGFGSAGTLTVDDADAMLREVPDAVTVSPEVRGFNQVAAGNQNWSTQIMGESAEYLDMRQWPLEEGNMFTEQDVRSATKVAILGHTVAQQLFGDMSPIGQVIRIKNSPFVVQGELTPKGLSVQGNDQDDIVIVPFTSYMKRVTFQTFLRTINVQANSDKSLANVQGEIIDLLRQRHRIQPGRDDDFTVRTQQEITEAATASSKTMRWLLLAIALVSLLVGGIGIMNIMLVSVTERTREIGIRMAVGAHGADILLQFLIEAVSISVIGGGLGVAAGVATSRILAKMQGWPMLTPTDWIFISFASSALVGILFGFYPAYKAAQLDPIDALRYE